VTTVIKCFPTPPLGKLILQIKFKIFSFKPEDESYLYKYQQITKEGYTQLTDVPIVQNDQSVYIFAQAN
jgi:hypothetical protein